MCERRVYNFTKETEGENVLKWFKNECLTGLLLPRTNGDEPTCCRSNCRQSYAEILECMAAVCERVD